MRRMRNIGGSRTRTTSETESPRKQFQSNFLNGDVFAALYENQGNTCYASSAQACLVQSQTFQNYLNSQKDSANVVIKELQQDSATPAVRRTHGIREKLGWNIAGRKGRQQDVTEYMQSMFETLATDNSEAVKQLSQITTQDVYTCNHCGDDKTVPASGILPFWALPVTKCSTLDECVSAYFSIGEEDKAIICDRCYQAGCKKKMVKITQYPPLLMVHLKRFGFVTEPGRKVPTNIKENQNIDIPLYWKPCAADDTPTYALTAVSVHVGRTPKGGHYESVIINAEKNVAYNLSDAIVTKKLNGQHEISQAVKQGYVLFYEKTGTENTTVFSPHKKILRTGDVSGQGDEVRRNIFHENGTFSVDNLINGRCKIDMQTINRPNMEKLYFDLTQQKIRNQQPNNQLRHHLKNMIVALIQTNKPEEMEQLCKKYNIQHQAMDEKEAFICKFLSKQIIFCGDNMEPEKTRNLLQLLNPLPPGLSIDEKEKQEKLVKKLIEIVECRVSDPGKQKELLKHYRLTGPAGRQESAASYANLIDRVCKKTLTFDAKTVSKAQAQSLLQKMQPTPADAAFDNKQKLVVVKMIDLIQTNVTDPKIQANLMKHYNLDKYNATTGEKNPDMFDTVAKGLGKILNLGGKRQESPMPSQTVWDIETVQSIAKILEELKQMKRLDILALHMQITGRKEEYTKKEDNRLKNSIKNDLVSRLVQKLNTKQQRDMLRKLNVEQARHDDKISSQLKMIVINNEKLLKIFVTNILGLYSQSPSLSVDSIADRIDILQNLESMNKDQMESLHMLVCGKPFDGKQEKSRCFNAVRKELCNSLVKSLQQDMIKNFIRKKINRVNVDEISQLTNLVVKHEDLLKELMTYLKQKDPLNMRNEEMDGNGTVERDSNVEQHVSTQRGTPVAANNSQMEDSTGDGVHMDTNNTMDSCDDNQSTAAAMSESSDDEEPENLKLSVEEAQDLLQSGSGQLEALTASQMTVVYRKLNGKAKRVPNRDNLIKFIKPKLVSMLLEFMLKRNANIACWILRNQGLETVSRKKKNKSLLQKAALQDGQEHVLEVILAVFADMKDKEFVSDFLPHNLSEIKENMIKNTALREKRTELMQQGMFMVQPENAEPNAIIEAGKTAQRKIDKIKFSKCIICTEKRLEMKLVDNTGICERCFKIIPKDPTMPHTYSAENNMDPGPVPLPLRNLTQLEQMAIAPNRSQLTLITLRGGGSKMRGHAFTFPQDIQPFVDKIMMPHRPEDVPLITIQLPGNPIPQHANRNNLREAIRWLCEHNPVYKEKVILSEENLACYPDDSVTPVENLRVILAEGEDNNQQTEQDAADEEEDDEDELDEHHGEEARVQESTVDMRIPVEATGERIREAILQTGDNQTEESGDQQPRMNVNFPARQGRQLVSEFNTAGYYTLSFPCLFPTGAGDITLARPGITVGRLDWFNHLIWLDIPGEPQNRFAKDTRFPFLISNQFKRGESLKLGAILADRMCKDMTLKDVQDAFMDPDHTLPKCMTLMTSQIPGTTGYFRQQRKKANSIERFVRILSDNKEQFNCFFTLSVADGHMLDLHRLLPNSAEYLDKTVVAELTDEMDPNEYISKKEDYRLRQANVVNNGHIVNDFIHRKLDIVREEILEKHYGMVDFIIRDEYQARTAIHFHVVARLVGLSKEDLDAGLKNYFFVEDMGDLSEEDRQTVINDHLLQGYTIVEEGKKEETLRVVEPARDRVIDYAVNTLGLNASFPEDDVELWPPPHGPNHTPPAINPLRQNILTVDDDPDQNLEQHYANLCCRVQIHGCKTGYCLKRRQNMPADAAIKCRFGYPLYEAGFEKGAQSIDPATGKVYYQRNRKPDCYEKGAEVHGKELVLLRNLSNLVMHLCELLIVWGCNMDARLITNSQALISYILKYITKAEENSQSYEKMLQDIATTAGNQEGCTVRQLAQKLIMSTVKEHDMGRYFI